MTKQARDFFINEILVNLENQLTGKKQNQKQTPKQNETGERNQRELQLELQRKLGPTIDSLDVLAEKPVASQTPHPQKAMGQKSKRKCRTYDEYISGLGELESQTPLGLELALADGMKERLIKPEEWTPEKIR